MVEVTLVKNRFRKEQWQQLILECQGSNPTVKDWFTQAGIHIMLIITGFVSFIWKHIVPFLFRL
jgi:hypothetical protein